MKYFYLLLFIFQIYPLAQELSYNNPIIPGSYPDPSICRVGNDYYIVNSSFEYFPGLPIHHSKDLVNWNLIGYGLHRDDQCSGEMNLVDVQTDGGIHAPSIRYHDGLFYIITTNVYSPGPQQPTEMINFIITAEQIEGPWSNPHIIEGAPGIDPDIIFDDGKVWYVGTHVPEKPNFNGEGEIWLQELDLDDWSLKGERYFLWRGALYYGTWAEGPHIYKRNGFYYLLIAEGGTSLEHAVMVSVSDNIKGPYVPNARNPILTSRHLSNDYWVNSIGHADLLELADGRWYMVALGIRSEIDTYSNMGRETHLIPVTWEEEPFEWKYDKIEKEWSDLPDRERFEKLRRVNYEWPVCSPLTGRVERSFPLPFPASSQVNKESFRDNFDSETLNLEWNFRRVPQEGTYLINNKEGYLRLFSSKNVIENHKGCSLLGIRQIETDFEFSVKMLYNPSTPEVQAGVSLFQKDDNYLTFTIEKNSEQNIILKLISKERKEKPIVVQKTFLKSYNDSIILKVFSNNQSYKYYYSLDNGTTFNFFAETSSDLLLSKGYTGAYMGIYSTSNGKNSEEYVDFDWVTLK
ncbi:MAG: glycoside hydrolase family 43 protein [Candidatus Marinimicrobia bacterium]|nr:glycoside hydrolase family 43 protein [Candidatus Neomarinimicrobiota bacterium]MBL7046513.1 glycoside hydrolase family 43 protein [Candidatus Neomarinimicrobiota bacterium]